MVAGDKENLLRLRSLPTKAGANAFLVSPILLLSTYHIIRDTSICVDGYMLHADVKTAHPCWRRRRSPGAGAPELTVGLTYDPKMTRDCFGVTERYGDIYVVVTPAVGSWFASLAAV